MNKQILMFLFFMSLFVLSGCLDVPLKYTPDTDFSQEFDTRKYAVTFSVDCIGIVEDGQASQEKYVEWLRDFLYKSGGFSSVKHRVFSEKSNYHIHFSMRYSRANEATALGLLLCCTYCTIPVWFDMYLDASAILYLNGVPIHSPSTSDAFRRHIWAPFLPIGLVWNKWWVWTTQEKKCCRYLINEIVNYQKHYL